MQIESLIRDVQAKLGVDVDGKAGPQTWHAIHRRIVGTAAADQRKAAADALTNARSEKVISTLLPQVRPYARALYFKARDNGIAINIISGLRTYAEQDALHAQGRSKPGNVVTDAPAGYSNHNFGVAFDVGIFDGNQYLGESPKYKAVGVLGMELGLEWGGNWKTLVDQPHFQLRPEWAIGISERDMLAEFRRRVAQGNALF